MNLPPKRRPNFPAIVSTLLLGAFVLGAFVLGAACGGDAEGDTRAADTASPLFPTDVSFADVPVGDTRSPLPDTTGLDTAAPCTMGSACNDNNPCTLNDRCDAGGRCAGATISCDDALPCTDDICYGGICKHTINASACAIAGACYSAGQSNPSNPCETCVPAAAAADWSNSDGLKCNDGDACTDGESCVNRQCQGGVTPSEVCDDNIDNDCDGLTDTADASDCEAPEIGEVVCAYHTDCYPTRLCGFHSAENAYKCSLPCAGQADCDSGYTCSKVPGSAQVGYCHKAASFKQPTGMACSDDSGCATGLCVDNVCVDVCFDENSCPGAGTTCQPVGDLAAGLATTACAYTPQGSKPLGAVCTSDGGQTFNGQLCAAGHCDTMPWPSNNLLCSPMCKSQTGCFAGQECGIVLYALISSPDAVPFDPTYITPTYDTIMACYSRSGSVGIAATGTVCTAPSQCGSGHCFPLLPQDPTLYCTNYCEFDAECPQGMSCKLEAVTLASAWLQATHVGSQNPAPSALSLVRVCKFD